MKIKHFIALFFYFIFAATGIGLAQTKNFRPVHMISTPTGGADGPRLCDVNGNGLPDFSCDFTSASNATGNKPVNIVLMVADDHGKDALGFYGNPVIQTPALDRLAAEGIRFNNAYCTSASCTASRSVILSGIYNHANGLYGHEHSYHHFRAFDDLQTLPVLLSKAGYVTARAGKYHVAPEEVFRFDVVLKDAGRNNVQLSENCRAFIEEAEQPFFLYYCTYDPHRSGQTVEGPHSPNTFGNIPGGHPGCKEQEYAPGEVLVPPHLPDSPETRAELVQYYQSVTRVDRGVERLMQWQYGLKKDEGNMRFDLYRQ